MDNNPDNDAGGDYGNGLVDPARRFLISRRLPEPAVSELRLADGDHYREMAGRVRELVRLTYSPGIRRELIDLARRYDRRGDHFDRRSHPEI